MPSVVPTIRTPGLVGESLFSPPSSMHARCRYRRPRGIPVPCDPPCPKFGIQGGGSPDSGAVGGHVPPGCRLFCGSAVLPYWLGRVPIACSEVAVSGSGRVHCFSLPEDGALPALCAVPPSLFRWRMHAPSLPLYGGLHCEEFAGFRLSSLLSPGGRLLHVHWADSLRRPSLYAPSVAILAGGGRVPSSL